MREMPQKTIDVKPGEYLAVVHEYDDRHQMTGNHTAVPTRVYRNGTGRQEIAYKRNGKDCHAQNWPGASTFELYKRVP
jgi:hypothetical protein